MFNKPFGPHHGLGPDFGPHRGPHHGHLHPLPPHYPYDCPNVHDSYAHECYHEDHGYPLPHEFPSGGPMMGSAFILQDYYPYLYDNTHTTYGAFLSVSESVMTRIIQRRDDSCISLDATFDLTDTIDHNTVLTQHLEQSIANQYESLQGYLPIIKSGITFRIYYHIEDGTGGLLYKSAAEVTSNQMVFHFTDIRDYFIDSLKSVMITNIPALDYTGMFKLVLDRMAAYGEVIDTSSRVKDGMNPYYQFANNNNKIVIQHDTICATETDGSVCLGYCDINKVFPFQGSLTTRLRISFTAFLSKLIAVPQTYGIWNAMYEPTDQKFNDAINEINTLKESVELINRQLMQINTAIESINDKLTEHDKKFDDVMKKIKDINRKVEDNKTEVDARLDDLEHRIEKLENRPVGIVRYKDAYEFRTGQLTYTEYGTLYQVAKEYIATGDIERDARLGNLVQLVGVVDWRVVE